MLLLLFSLLLASFLVVLVTKPISHDLESILEFFKQTSEQNTGHKCGREVSKASRHLHSLIKRTPALSQHDKQTALKAAMLALKSFPNQEKIILLAMTLLSLHSSDNSQFLLEQISNDLQFIIHIMNSSLSHAKAIDEPLERDERLSAEIQKRGCLFLGGLAENDDVARQAIEMGGLDAIIDSLRWYRYHSGVCKWGLWAVFHLCYDRSDYQSELASLSFWCRFPIVFSAHDKAIIISVFCREEWHTNHM